jgi:prophage regulatory protein
MDRLLRMPTVIEKTGLARSTIYALSKAGEFPRAKKISHRAVAWVESDVDSWIEEKKGK